MPPGISGRAGRHSSTGGSPTGPSARRHPGAAPGSIRPAVTRASSLARPS
ncbi:MAG TPA: hypothetical protein VFJ69_08045 [Actinomycetota bacterium]|nr:hypothetical protein [Actinomycetota bacterium]